MFVSSQVNWPAENECSASRQGQVTTVAIFSITDTQGAFLILVVGVLLSSMVFGWELWRAPVGWERPKSSLGQA